MPADDVSLDLSPAAPEQGQSERFTITLTNPTDQVFKKGGSTVCSGAHHVELYYDTTKVGATDVSLAAASDAGPGSASAQFTTTPPAAGTGHRAIVKVDGRTLLTRTFDVSAPTCLATFEKTTIEFGEIKVGYVYSEFFDVTNPSATQTSKIRFPVLAAGNEFFWDPHDASGTILLTLAPLETHQVEVAIAADAVTEITEHYTICGQDFTVHATVIPDQ